MKLRPLLAIALSASFLACASTPEAPPPEDEAPVVGPPEVAWADMSKEQRGRYMKKVVLPEMKQLFVGFDAGFAETFTCKTCHGEDPQGRGFEMPSPHLEVLPSEPAAFQKFADDHPEWIEFMSTKVRPRMASLLGLPEYDPQNPQPGAFGCTNCHTMEAAAP